MATYLFSENRELKNIQDGDSIVWDCGSSHEFEAKCIKCSKFFKVVFIREYLHDWTEIYTAHFKRIQADTEPQSAPNTPVPMGSN